MPNWFYSLRYRFQSLRRCRPSFSREEHFELMMFLSRKVSDMENMIKCLEPDSLPEDLLPVRSELSILKSCLRELRRNRRSMLPF